jgi:hypothetical protein
MNMKKWILAGALILAVGAASATEPKKSAKHAAPKAAASAEIICGPQGCRPVQAGCHVEQRVYMGMSGTMNVEVCGK